MAARYIVQLDRKVEVEDRGSGDALPVLVMLGKHPGWGSTWLAEVTDVDEETRGGFVQEFLDVESQSLSNVGAGSVLYRIDTDGIYQANSIWRSYTTHRVVFRVQAGQVTLLAGAESLGDTMPGLKATLHEAVTGQPLPLKRRKSAAKK
jgi:hypothetical protein